MSLPLVVVILVAAGDGGDVSTQTLTATAQEALPAAIVLLREVVSARDLSDAEAMRIGLALHADAVALVTWPEDDHVRAHVHVFAAKRSTWVDRDIAFVTTDAPSDRGVTLGFTVASMVPREVAETERSEEALSPNAPSPPLRPARPAPAQDASPHRASIDHASIDVVASGDVGVGGPAPTGGGGLAARLRLGQALWARVGSTLHFGSLPAAKASSTTVRVAAGIAWHPFFTSGATPLDLGVRVDFVVLRQGLSRLLDDGSSATGGRWLPAVDLLVEGAWSFRPPASLVAAMGSEVAFGPTRVLVNDVRVATLPAVRMIGELGLRVSF